MINVLVAEDSPVVKQLLVRILQADPEIRVVGGASNGVEAVHLAEVLRPDVITMDIRMPKMDGVEATQLIMAECPTRIIVVSASVDSEESRPAFEAMKAGALVVVDKPRGLNHKDFDQISARLIKTVKTMSTVKVVTRWRRINQVSLLTRKNLPFKIIAMGASTGGPAAIAQILGNLPSNLSVPILIVQHMTPGFGSAFVDWLDTENSIPVKVAAAGDRLLPGQVYVAPDNYHTGVNGEGKIFLTDKKALHNHHRPSINYMFKTIAKYYGSKTLGIVLTGMGQDGAKGLREIKQAGGETIAQDEASSIVYGMAKSAVALGAIDYVISLDKISSTILQLIHDQVQEEVHV